MKLLALVLVIGIVCAVLFLIGVLSPRRSRRLQALTGTLSKKAERKSEQKAGRFGDFTRDALRRSRHAADRSAEKGRRIRDET